MDQDQPGPNYPLDDATESGRPGGGVGRREDVRGSGVYPASGPLPEGNAPYIGEQSWGQGDRGAAGYDDHGDSELDVYELGPDAEVSAANAEGKDAGAKGQGLKGSAKREEFPNQESLDEESQIGSVPEDQEQLEP